MDHSESTQELSSHPAEEHIQLVPVSVTAPPSAKTSLQQLPEDTHTVSTACFKHTSSGPENAPSKTHATTHSQASACGSCGSAAATTVTPRAVEEGMICDCQTPGCPPQCPARIVSTEVKASTVSVLRVESERPGPSGSSRRAAADGSSASPGPLLPPVPGTIGGKTPCCAAAAQPCHVLSLPDMLCHQAGCEAAAAAAQLSPTIVATSSDSTTGQAPARRPSAGSGIRAALQSVTSHVSPLSSVGPFCRICHEGESRELLISPCRCAGSVGLVHVSCIEKWLSAANKDSCEICMYQYVTERRPKRLLEWLLNPSNPEDARNLAGDIICFFLLTVLAVIAAYLCLMGASHYLSYKTQWEATGLVVLGLIISSIYCVWLVVTCRYHCRVWGDWRRTHQDVHLLEMKPRSQVVDVNFNSVSAAVPSGWAGAGCRVCHGGSYSCSHCCAVCPVHGAQPTASPAAAAADAEGVIGADDVFDDEPDAGGSCGTLVAPADGQSVG